MLTSKTLDKIFRVESPYTHSEIISGLSVGNSGGIRVAKAKGNKAARIVLFTTSEQDYNFKDNPYTDQSSGDKLTYTGTGKFGEQSLSGPNKRLAEQQSTGTPIYVFSLTKHRKASKSPASRWKFQGIYTCVQFHKEDQIDLLGNPRSAWIFHLTRVLLKEAGPSVEDLIVTEILKSQSLQPPKDEINDPSAAQIASSKEVESIMAKMANLDPFSFEQTIKATLSAAHFRNVRITKKSADGGIDVHAVAPDASWALGNQLVQIQAKRWVKPVGRREVSELRGSLHPHAIGTIITTGFYTKTAIDEARRINILPITLIDGYRFASVIRSLNLFE